MSRMKSRALVAAGAIVSMGLSGMHLLGLGRIDEAMFARMPKGRSDGRSVRRKHRSRYQPHQGGQEISRRVRQMMGGQLRCWQPPIEPMPVERTASERISAATAEAKERNRIRAEKAARTRAANRAAKLEAANG